MTSNLTKIMFIVASLIFISFFGFIVLGGIFMGKTTSTQKTTSTTSSNNSSTASDSAGSTAANTNTDSSSGSSTGTGTYTAATVSQHNSASSCWLLIDSKVYDVTKYLASGSHRAGNSIIIQYCGTDATSAFGVHNNSGYNTLNNYYIGSL